MLNLLRIDQTLRESGYTFDGLRIVSPGTPDAILLTDGRSVVVDGLDPGNRAAVVAILTAYTARRPRTLAAIRDAILALTAAERNRLLAKLVALLALERPGLLARLGSSIPDDEPAP